MRIQIAPDLHHELATSGSAMSQPLPRADNEVELLVLAGDIQRAKTFSPGGGYISYHEVQGC